MEQKFSSKTSLFLIELIIVILFFSIASSVCIQLFVKSHILSQDTQNNNQSIIWVQNLSEIYHSKRGDFEALKSFYPDSCTTAHDLEGSTFLTDYSDYFYIFLDSDWKTVAGSTNARYLLLALSSSDSTFQMLDLCLSEIPAPSEQFSTYEAYLNYLTENNIWNYHIHEIIYQQRTDANEPK